MQQPLLPDWSAGRTSPAYHPFRGVTEEFGPRLESHICHFWLPLASRSPSHRAWLRCHWCQRQFANEEYKKSRFERRFHSLFPTVYDTHTADTVLYHPVWQVSSWAFKASVTQNIHETLEPWTHLLALLMIRLWAPDWRGGWHVTSFIRWIMIWRNIGLKQKRVIF